MNIGGLHYCMRLRLQISWASMCEVTPEPTSVTMPRSWKTWIARSSSVSGIVVVGALQTRMLSLSLRQEVPAQRFVISVVVVVFRQSDL